MAVVDTVATRRDGDAAETVSPGDSAGTERGPTLATVLGLASALVGFGLGASRLGDNSFLTHLATGREMLESGIVRADVFTWTSQGEGIVVQSWLASLLYGVVDELAGFHGLRLLTAVLAAVLATACWKLTERSPGLWTRVALMVPVLVIGRTTWSERPLLIAFVLLAVTLVVAEGAGRTRWLLPVGFVWVGVHGSWPLGIIALAARWAGGRLDGERAEREVDSAKWLVAGMVIGGTVNPYGPALLLFPLRLLGNDDVLAHVVEWQSPSFDSLWTRAFLLLVLATIAGVAHRPRWSAAVPAAVFIAAALVGRRNIPIATIVLLPGLAAALPSLGARIRDRRSEAVRLAVLALGALLVLLPLVAVRGPHLDLGRFPEAAVTAMEEDLGLVPGETRIIHQDFVGNYLDIRYGDRAASWIDDRFELHDPELVDDYITLLDGRSGWTEVLDRYEAAAILWPLDAPLTGLAVAGGWAEVWTDEDWVVLCNPDRAGCGGGTPWTS